MGREQTFPPRDEGLQTTKTRTLTSRPHVVICGYYGFGNLGDELILEAILEQFRSTDVRFTVISGNLEETIHRHRVSAVPFSDVEAIATALREADLVVIGGGGLFQEHWGTDLATLFGPNHANLTYYPAMAVLATSQGVPVAIHSVGVGPLVSANGKQLVRAAVEAAGIVSVRDPKSREILEELGCDAQRIVVSADPVFALEPKLTAGEKPPRKRPLLGINLRPWSVGTSQFAWEHEVFEALLRLGQRFDCEFLLLPFHRSSRAGESDESVLARFQNQAQQRGLSASWATATDGPSMMQAIASCDALLVMRYHAVALAAMAGKSLLAIAYDPKVAHLTAQLDIPTSCVPLSDLSATGLFNAICEMLRNPSSSRATSQRIAGLRRSAFDDGRRLLEFLKSGPTEPRPLHPSGVWVLGQGLARIIAERKRLAEQLQGSENQRAWAEAEREAAGRAAARLDAEVDRLSRELSALTSKYQELSNQYGEQQREVERLVRENQSLASQVAYWETKYQQLVEQYGERQREVEKLHQLLKEITSSRWFRLASFYWRLVGPKKASGGSNPHIPAAPPDPSAGMPEAENANQVAALVPQQAPAPVKGERGERFDVLCLPIIDWDFRFQRPQQLASQFAKRGHRVFYLSQKFHTLGAPFTASEKTQLVWEVSLKGPKRNVYQDMMDDETAYAYFEAVDALRREHGLGATAVIVQLPFWWPLARLLHQRFGWPVIYDCMDYHAGFSTNRPEMLQQEDELLAGCDLVVVPSKFLQDHTQKHNPRVLVVPNACDFEHFAKVPHRPPANPPTIGYYGAIADWFDSGLVADLAELRPQWRFLLVGSTFTADTTRLSRLPNVELVGEKPYGEIPSWVAQMDCLIIPFKRTPLTDATNPVKFFEIMAAGKPLVSVPLPELAPYKDFVSFAENPEEFARQIENALRANGPELVSVRRAFAQQHTWEKRFEMLIPHVAAAFPKVSIVVVTYNNLDLTRQCLESVLTRTEWPNYELFVVDNGSTDGTPDYLWELASKDSRLRVICNPENRGFAAANNQALRLAEGDFLVLLNNDTVVPRGWLSGLVRHLSAHPDFGLVGPVTNWIGNEAQIPVGYKRLEDMPRWAEGYVREHDGEFFDISVAALFCAAMRRDTFLRVGELDERFGAGMFEDDDYAIRVREVGLRVVCVEDVFVHHHGKAAFKQMEDAQYQELFERNRKLFEAKWGKPWVPHRYRSQ